MAVVSLHERTSSFFKSDYPIHLHRKGKASVTKLAYSFWKFLQPGDILALCGEMGAGKTFFTSSFCSAIAPQEGLYVTSPTYTIANVYNSQPQIAHLDLYRLQSEDDFFALGGEEYFQSSLITLVEWAQRLPTVLPQNSLWMSITSLPDNQRRFILSTSFEMLQKSER